MRQLVRKVPLSRTVQDYAVRVLQATHPDTSEATDMVKKYVRYGASPRGVQTVILAAKIRGLLQNRYAVSIDDVHAVARPALRHRILLNFEGEAEGVDVDNIISATSSNGPPRLLRRSKRWQNDNSNHRHPADDRSTLFDEEFLGKLE